MLANVHPFITYYLAGQISRPQESENVKLSGKSILRIARLLTVLGLMVGGMQAARADVNCKIPDGQTYPYNTTVPLSGSFYVGNDMPNGSVLYMSGIQTDRGLSLYVNCDAAFSLNAEYRAQGEPAGAPFSQSGTFFTGKVFPTNVSGVGVALVNRPTRESFTDTEPNILTNYYQRDSAGSTGRFQNNFYVLLVKTGPITSGATVNASSFPTVSLNVPAQPGYTGLPINNIWVAHLTGSIQLITRTCTTPDVTADLGQHLHSEFASVGATTAWQYTPIVMTNCPTFTGHYGTTDGSDGGWQGAYGSEAPSGGTPMANLFEITLTPTTGLVNASDTATFLFENSDPAPATGVGYQLGYNTDINSTTIGSGMVWHKGQAPISISLPSDGRSTIKIPLFLRYASYSARVTPGPMNGKIVATINYK